MTVSAYIMVEGQQMDAALQPPQSGLQGAFRKSGQSIAIHMPTARGIARDMIRQARAAKFAEIDARRGAAIDDDDAVERAAVKAAAKKLKDAPQDPRIAAATTPDKLLAAVEAIIAEF